MEEHFLFYLLLLSLSTLLSLILFFYFYIRFEVNAHGKLRFFATFFTAELPLFFLCYFIFSPIILISGTLINSILFFILFYRDFYYKKWFSNLLEFITCLSLCILFCYAYFNFFSYDYNNSIILFVIFNRFFLSISFLSLLIYKNQTFHLLPKTSSLIIIPPIFHTIICLTIVYLWSYSIESQNLILLSFICLICFVSSLLDLTLFTLFIKTATQQELSLQINLTKQHLEHNWNYYESAKEHMDEIHSLKAEFYQKIHSVYRIVYQKDSKSKEQALNLLNSLKNRINQTKSIYFCKHPIINTILEEYDKKTALHKIYFEIDIRDIDNIFLENNELYTIFSFLLSDAMEDTCQLQASPCIGIFTYQKANFFIIKEKHNGCNTDRNSKQLRSYHQLILNRLVKKYHGNLQIKSDEFYTTILMFPFPE